MNVSIAIILMAVAFVAGTLFESGGRGKEQDAKNLRKILDDYHGILGRPDGKVEGIVIDDDEEYEDDDLGVTRERLRYLTLDGEERVEPKDGFNPKRGALQKLVKVKPNGSGLYLTELTNPKTGERMQIEKGKGISRLREEADNIQAVKKELDGMSNEYRSMKEKLKKQENKNAQIEEDRQTMETNLKQYREANSRLRNLVESLKARADSAEAKAHMLTNEVRNLGEMYNDTQDDVKKILEKANQRFELGDQLGASGSPFVIEKGKQGVKEREQEEEETEKPEREEEGEESE